MKAVRFGVVGLALVAALALSGCGTSPSEAFRIGDVTLSNSAVDDTAQEFANALVASGSTVADPVAKVRDSVVSQTIFLEVARRYAAEKGLTVAAPDYAATATSLGVDPADPYARLTAEVSPYLDALRSKATPRQPTEDEERQVYKDFQAVAGADAATFDEIKGELAQLPEYAESLGLRDALMDAMNRYGVTVNPRYQPLQFPLLVAGNGQLILVSLPIGQQGTGAVRNV